MSMIGVLINNLNKSADEWNGSNMFELAHMCRDAADTIWQLRDDLQRANTEKAALERRIDELCTEVEYDRQTSRSRLERIDRLKAENAKLRELVAELWALADGYTPDDSELDTARDLMTELGIEVDE